MKKKRIVIGDSVIEVPDISRRWISGGVLILLLLWLIFSSMYTVNADETAVIQRFGKFVRTTQPGLHFKLPFGIETKTPVRTQHVFKMEFGFRTIQAGVRTVYSQKEYQEESLMLTGDLNTAVVEWIVQYRIKDPVKFLFKVRDIDKTMRDVSEAAMRQVVGDHSVDEVIILSRREIADTAEVKMQRILDPYDTGIHIQTVQLQDVNPPDRVKPAFNEVNEAKQEREKIINEAWEAYNKAIPQAKGEAQKTINEAEGYALQRVNNAKGDAERFIAVYREYVRAKDVTRRRLYLETLREILPQIDQVYVIDAAQKNVVPLLQMLEKGGSK